VPGGQLVLEDAVQFQSAPGTFETALITLGEVELQPGAAILRDGPAALRVVYDASAVQVRVEQHDELDFPEGPGSLRRVVFALPGPVREGGIRLVIKPD
jgi:hypothetical protein